MNENHSASANDSCRVSLSATGVEYSWIVPSSPFDNHLIGRACRPAVRLADAGEKAASFFVRSLLSDQASVHRASERFRIRRDDPSAPGHYARAVVDRISLSSAGNVAHSASRGRQERLAPASWAVVPARRHSSDSFASAANFSSRGPSGSAWNRTRAGTLGSLLRELARSQHDAHRLLHALEDARRHLRLVALGRAVDHPDVGAGAPQIVAHLLETRPVEESRDGDEADDALLVFFGIAGGGVMAGAEDLPRRPAPEIDVEVPQVLGVRADAPLRRRRPAVERRGQVVRLIPFRSSRRVPRPFPCRADCRSRR